MPAPNGSVDLVLRLNLQKLLSQIDTSTYNNGEATSHPIPKDPAFFYANEDFCKKQTQLQYIIYVHSSPPNVDRRRNIRDTWANPDLFLDGRTKVVFVMGKASDDSAKETVQNEIEKYGDIVQGDFLDDYQNLTIKGILGLKWLSSYCKQAKYAIKADDDAFVNIFKLLKLLEKQSNPRLVACPLWKTMPILRESEKCMKWCVKYSEFPGKNFFPKYCAGLSFTLSRDVAQDMYQAASSTPFFWIDDVYITGLLLGKTKNVEYIDLLKNFTLKEAEALKQYTNYDVQETYYFSHVRNSNNMGLLWHATLERLPAENLLEIDPTVYSSYADIIERVRQHKRNQKVAKL